MKIKKEKHFTKLAFWVTLSIIFNLFIYIARGEQAAVEYFGGYIIEMSLSLDNLFLFLMIFSSFGISLIYQERVLKYGIFGAMILRMIFIILGVKIVNKFHWVIYIFGFLLIFSAFKMLFKMEQVKDFKENIIIKGLNRIIPVTSELVGNKFFVFQNNVLCATPLFAILLIIESSDVMFALDSIPAIFSITTDPFIVYTSNIFAILGLRSMYYLLFKLNDRFQFMKYGIIVILMFTGIKLIILYFNIEISALISVLIIIIILLGSILLSLIFYDEDNSKKSNSIK
ncbi:tellurite resistance protein TerC [Clostridium gasigenes]|uniref:Tellurite resistance protein TerC n=1 Tax=Clostridium gasigenes TaxID=94869 RepID=A0A1H0NF77_9CLOT|nr:TerC/Alx family metal homeostasis membrane protein [Clostridium gasigenes]NKF05451.1 TerC/Alx family metal homeostasis membrane protein [Clostridium gasigenes]QSW18897.1 TerC/Alx family metal homeostasis membrane protein [Clostridium gasigenes]SDO91268.1 tellurite resistance protein TerC [Clostridium gasigenes]